MNCWIIDLIMNVFEESSSNVLDELSIEVLDEWDSARLLASMVSDSSSLGLLFPSRGISPGTMPFPPLTSPQASELRYWPFPSRPFQILILHCLL